MGDALGTHHIGVTFLDVRVDPRMTVFVTKSSKLFRFKGYYLRHAI
jgi:hypothetical protein